MLATPPQQDRSRRSLERILDAAKTVLMRGADEFTVANVAQEGGLTVGGIYARFKSKDELLQALKERTIHTLVHAAETELGKCPADSIESVLDIFAVLLLRHVEEDGVMQRHLLSAADTNPLLYAEGGQGREKIRQIYCETIARVPGFEDPDLQPFISVSFELCLCPWLQRIKLSWFHDELGWSEFIDQLREAAVAYLHTLKR